MNPKPLTEYQLFETALGTCAVAWNALGLVGVWLPEASPDQTRDEVLHAHLAARPALPPDREQAVVDGITALLNGAPVTFADTVLDDAAQPAFNRAVYQVTLDIPPGRTLSYGQVATRLGSPGASRAVGRALGANPWPIVVPCHRVLAADGAMHGFSAPGCLATKRRMLQLEGALAPDEPTLF